MNRFKLCCLLLLLLMAGCSNQKKQNTMDQSSAASPELHHYTLTNHGGVKMEVTNFGAKIISLWVPDRSGKLGDVVLGYDSASQYPGGNLYFGAVIGRYGNRIAQGRFSLEGKTYQLARNNGKNHLHGGPGGFHNVYWETVKVSADMLVLHYMSRDGEEGYPGNLSVTLTYTLTDKNELVIEYGATTDQATVVNLTQHSYFNLAGEGNGDILNHRIQINADLFTPVDKGLIPLGAQKKVEGTPFDFRTAHSIGERITRQDEQLSVGKGYDHNWILNKKGHDLTLAARVEESTFGRVMEVWTTEPALQFYTGNFLDGTDHGKGGKPYAYRTGFCLEAQHYPDSPNHPEYPTTELKPGEKYFQKTVYKFL